MEPPRGHVDTTVQGDSRSHMEQGFLSLLGPGHMQNEPQTAKADLRGLLWAYDTHLCWGRAFLPGKTFLKCSIFPSSSFLKVSAATPTQYQLRKQKTGRSTQPPFSWPSRALTAQGIWQGHQRPLDQVWALEGTSKVWSKWRKSINEHFACSYVQKRWGAEDGVGKPRTVVTKATSRSWSTTSTNFTCSGKWTW